MFTSEIYYTDFPAYGLIVSVNISETSRRLWHLWPVNTVTSALKTTHRSIT